MQKMLLLVGKTTRKRAPAVSFATMLALLALSPQAQANPTIENVSASTFGVVPGYVSGRVSGVNPADYKVAVLIFVEGLGFYSKPYCDATTTSLAMDGSFNTLITTGGTDQYATLIAILAVPVAAAVPCYLAEPGVPAALEQQAVAEVLFPRPNPNQREIQFAGETWVVKSSTGRVGPGLNYFSDSTDNVSVDNQGRLHFHITNRNGLWYCAEIISKRVIGLGQYSVQIETLPQFDQNVVFGAFSWADAERNSREIDLLELGRFGNASDPNNAQNVVQPYTTAGNQLRFVLPSIAPTIHQMTWLANSLTFQSSDQPGAVLHQWTYGGQPPSTDSNRLNFRLNFWLFAPPADGKETEIVVSKFSFVSACAVTFSPPSPVTTGAAGGNASVGLTFGTSGCGWSATSNVPWITSVPPSGTGNGFVNYTVAPNTGPLRSGTITIAGQNYMVNQSAGGPDTTAPFGFFDMPADGTNNVVGAIGVTGWALDNVGVTRVDIYRDPVSGESGQIYVGTADFVVGARSDVQSLYPNYPNANRAGWGYQLLTNFLPNHGNGTFKLHAIAYDAANNSVELSAPGKLIVCTNATAAKPFGTIDTPSQGGPAAGTQFVNFGWALTPGAAFTIPTNGSTITVILDGQPMGHPVYNQFRSDIASLFPGYTNSQGAVGYYYLDSTKLSNGVHTISWNVFDNGGRGEGLGSRYFSIANGPVTVPSDELQLERNAGAVTLRTGLDLDGEPTPAQADGDGWYAIEIEEFGRIELHAGVTSGYLVAGDERGKLPAGSSFRGGVFYWLLGPGFVGEYQLVLIRPNGEQVPVRVKVRPKTFSPSVN